MGGDPIGGPGVAQHLRTGVRESIQLLATEVLARRRARGLPLAEGLVAELTRQCLRLLYRILFLLYAEARPDLDVLSAAATAELDRVRELALAPPSGVAGTGLYESLAAVLRLVGDTGSGTPRADLFSREATALIDEVGLGDGCLRRVLALLVLAAPRRGRDREVVPYARIGVNELGAVYEGLLSYAGSIAEEPMVEVARDGDPTNGSRAVPESSTPGLDPRWFVTAADPRTGAVRAVRHEPGEFVLRQSGRGRQRTGSYYTRPELTRCVVTHALAELLPEDVPAARLLELTVCESALGSGAFLVEAIDQLAARYLARRQRELATTIEPDRYPVELQRVKAHLALHNCYGVDLDATAVELAEITLLLDCMHPGLRAPWFGLRLRRGNSLIGARRESWTPAQIAGRGWLDTVPTARPLGTAVADEDVHHFLLPAPGWGAVADAGEARERRPDACAALKAWRAAVTAPLGAAELVRLQALGQRVEVLWALALRRLRIAEAGIRTAIPVWGADALRPGTVAVRREQVEASLADPDGAHRRLRRVMDAWAALWFWPVTAATAPPTRDDWITALEALLGAAGPDQPTADLSWAELDEAERQQRVSCAMKPVDEVLAAHPWLRECAGIAEREGFFHWELDFAAVFAERGGFDLQVGNPPWVRPRWNDRHALAAQDAWFDLVDTAPPDVESARRAAVLGRDDDAYLEERTRHAGVTAHLSSPVDRPTLLGVQTDLYRCFIDRSWRLAAPGGVVGLIHQVKHLTEAGADGFRGECYRRLRRLWHFVNQRKLFDIGNTRDFGVAIYGEPREVSFLSAAHLYRPETLERSLPHDGSGPEPGIKTADGDWDETPHRSRLIEVDAAALASWAQLAPPDRRNPAAPPFLYLVTRSLNEVVGKLLAAPRLERLAPGHTHGWIQRDAQRDGFIANASGVPTGWDEVILQGPHLGTANPLSGMPNPTMRSHRDFSPIDPEAVGAREIPRTSFQRACQKDDYQRAYPAWRGAPERAGWRLAWRRRVDPHTERTLRAAIVPPGTAHIHQVWSLSLDRLPDLAIAAGLWASLPVDFMVKFLGCSDVTAAVFGRFPHVDDHPLVPELIHRALRLNCLTAAWAPLWEQLFDPAWRTDAWTREIPAAPLGAVGAAWTSATPLRRAVERRQALVELDALAAVMLGITAAELCSVYRTQFGVLRQYERVMRHDANGRQVPRDVLKEYERYGIRADLGRYELPFTPVDREAEMTVAHADFDRRREDRANRRVAIHLTC